MVHELENLDKFIDICGSRYAATIFVGRKARELAERYDNVISHAEALSWLLSGKVPEGVRHYSERIKQREQRYLAYAEEHLVSVRDDKIRVSVLKSLEKSRNSGHLIYHYEQVYDYYHQARIRILTNKLWTEIREMEVII